MESEVRKENKMGTMPMTRLILSMSLPAIFSMTIQAMYNVVDSIFIGNFDLKGLTAVSLAYPMQMLLISVAVGTAVGVNSLVSRKLGEREYDDADSAATHGLVLCGFSYIIFLILGIFASRPFISAYSQDPVIVEYGTQYLTWVLCCSIFPITQVMIEKTLQATGNMIYPMLFQLLGAIVNIIFDPLLIFGIGFFPRLGVTGAAIATVFGQFCGMVFAMIILFCKKHHIKIRLKGFRLNATTLKNIYSVGLPSIIMQSISSVMIIGMNTIFTMANSPLSETSVTVLGIYFKLQSFVFMPCFGLNQGVMPIIGYNYGARNKKRMYGALIRGIAIAVGIMTVGTILMWTIPDLLISMFGGGDELMRLGVKAFRIVSLCFIPAAVGILMITVFQATGKGFRSLLISFCRQLLLILPIATILSMTAGIESVWYAFPLAEVVALIIALALFVDLVKTDFKKLN